MTSIGQNAYLSQIIDLIKNNDIQNIGIYGIGELVNNTSKCNILQLHGSTRLSDFYWICCFKDYEYDRYSNTDHGKVGHNNAKYYST